MKKTYLALSGFLTASLVVFGCLFDGAAAAAAAPILVATDVTFPPFESVVAGKPQGFDIDLIHAIAAQENLHLEIKSMPFTGIIPSLQSDAVTIAISGMFITQARNEQVLFSNAYYRSGLAIVAPKTSTITSFDELKQHHVVGAKKATGGAHYLARHGVDSSLVKQFDTTGAMFQALLSGAVDATVFDATTSHQFVKDENGKVKIVGPLLAGAYFGIAVNKKHPDLLAKINDGLAKIHANGTYDKLFTKWFGAVNESAVNKVITPTQAIQFAEESK